MKAKEAIAQAKALLSEFFEDEPISSIRLEEVEFDEPNDSWLITLSVFRPPIRSESAIMAQAFEKTEMSFARTYKILRIPNNLLAEPSMKIRELQSEG